MTKASLSSLFSARFFLGSHRQSWNPVMSGIIGGLRGDLFVMNLQQATYRLQKFLLLLKLIASDEVFLFLF